ncbi:DUF1489 domain-containing protein [Acidisoma cellulosilytica]|uniref:DUF1489 domain-containing protein n=1 Tax=Acidisoma cellulosilyticum TaxID=2802395 RepID=A0A964E2Z4_9PROT|nr:DUF1489 domain-containing protein [Acidisoma cellulosilyticum]MCB8879318.1 DUF1489 domain-containing protein [Acidisoma cellulosilyticum]
MVHLIKLSVGIRDVDHLRAAQRERALSDPPLRHRTRHGPKRREEILDGGSIYWVIAGMVQARQRVLDIESAPYEDGSAATAFVLDPNLVLVEPRPTKPFQGWRYLNRNDAPQDLGEPGEAGADLPPGLRLALRELCLL